MSENEKTIPVIPHEILHGMRQRIRELEEALMNTGSTYSTPGEFLPNERRAEISAPEHIYVIVPGETDKYPAVEWPAQHGDYDSGFENEYTRSDIADQRIRKLEAALAECSLTNCPDWIFARNAVRWFENEYMGQDAKELWRLAVQKTAQALEGEG